MAGKATYFTTDPSLADHRRHGQRLIAPWNQFREIPGTASSWHLQRMPELVWIGELIQFLGPKESLDVLAEIVQAAANANGPAKPVAPSLACHWTAATDKEIAAVRSTLKGSGGYARLKESLDALLEFYPKYPLARLVSKRRKKAGDPDKLQRFKIRLTELMSRFSRPTVQVHTHVFLADLRAKRLLLPKDGLPLPDLNIVYDPTADQDCTEYKMASGFVRASAGALFGMVALTSTFNTAAYFWERGLELEECCPLQVDEHE